LIHFYKRVFDAFPDNVFSHILLSAGSTKE